jgi:hypothetical protein
MEPKKRKGRGCRWSGGNPFGGRERRLPRGKILEEFFDGLIDFFHVL